MPNVSAIFRSEISRVARKEVRSATAATHQAVAAHRRQIADLKRRLLAVERELKQLRQRVARTAPEPREADSPSSLRFRAEGFAQHRKRLGLSAREVGLLIGASSLSVYKWETGTVRPREKHLQAIAQLRAMGKREARRRLEQMAG